MKVLLTADTVGGVWDHAATLARELCARGDEVLVAVVGEPRDGRLAHLPAGVQVVSRPYRLEWMAGAANDVRAAGEWLEGLAAAWRPDVVHLNQMAYAVRRFGAPVLVAVHSDVLSWWSEVLGEAPPPAAAADYTRWVRAGLAAADMAVAPTAYQARLVRARYGARSVQVVHNGVYPPEPPPPEARDPLVLAVGRAWDAGKGMDLLDEAAGRLGAGAPPVHLLGETVGPSGERFAARHVALHGRVTREAVDAWMGRAAIYAAPSRYEPFGLAPLEAALHGCALVLSDIGSFRELWDGCAEFFPCGDSRGLADAIGRLNDDPERLRQRAAAARKRALRRYTAERMAAGYRALYHALRHPAQKPRATVEMSRR